MSGPAGNPLVLILVATVLQAVVQGTLTGRIGPANSLLFSALAFGTAAAVFSALGRLRRTPRPAAGARLRDHRSTMIWMNVATMATFLSFYVSLSLIPASTTSSLESAFGPLAVAVLAGPLTGRRIPLRPLDVGLISALAVLGLVLAARTWTPTGGDPSAAPVGLALAVVAGWGMAAVTLLSRRLGDAGVGAVPVTAHRFHLTYLAAGALWLAGRPEPPSPDTLLFFLGCGVVAVVVPLFLMQVGLQRADPLPAMAIVVTLPGLTWLVQFAVGAPTDMVALALVIGVMAVSAAYLVLQRHGGRAGPAGKAMRATGRPGSRGRPRR